MQTGQWHAWPVARLASVGTLQLQSRVWLCCYRGWEGCAFHEDRACLHPWQRSRPGITECGKDGDEGPVRSRSSPPSGSETVWEEKMPQGLPWWPCSWDSELSMSRPGFDAWWRGVTKTLQAAQSSIPPQKKMAPKSKMGGWGYLSQTRCTSCC